MWIWALGKNIFTSYIKIIILIINYRPEPTNLVSPERRALYHNETYTEIKISLNPLYVLNTIKEDLDMNKLDYKGKVNTKTPKFYDLNLI